jgi:SAM-dependent methyltransferase
MYLEQVLTNATDLTSDSPELSQAIKDWPSCYHLSPERSNLLRTLGIDRNSHVLELGCGCGAITRYLGEHAGKVTAVEGSPTRARIARLRCRDLDNVDVIATNFDNISFADPFDIVTLIGVLEYASIFWRRDGDPFEGVLKLAAQNLTHNGMLVIAIENKLGIKYLSGCTEDHLPRHFIGVEGYPDGFGPRTFGRSELQDLVSRSGFVEFDLLLPFPDYKIPSTLINSRFTTPRECREFNLVDWCRQPFQDYTQERENLFSDTLALSSMAENGLLADCANSFLLIASKSQIGPDSPIHRAEWIAKKFNIQRRAAFQTITTLQYQEGIPFIKKELVKNAFSPEVALVKHRIASTTQFIEGGTSLSLEMLRALRCRANVEQRFSSLVAAWVQFLQQYLLAGTDTLPPRFLDCIPDNLIITQNGTLHFIDDEWHWHIPVPIDWVIFRGLLVFWLKSRTWIANSLMQTEYRFGEFLAAAMKSSGITITDERLENLATMEAVFQKAVIPSLPLNYGALLHNIIKERPSSLAQQCSFLKSENEKLRNDLAVQHQKTSEQVAINEHLRQHAGDLQYALDRFRRYRELAETLIAEKDATIAASKQHLQLVIGGEGRSG